MARRFLGAGPGAPKKATTMKLFPLIAAASLLALPALAQAQTINFDEVQDGTVINTTYSSLGVTFTGETAFSSEVQATTDNGAFASNALDATHGVVDMLFDPAKFAGGLSSFGFFCLPDPAGFGSKSASVNFFDGNGALVYSSSGLDQTTNSSITFTSAVLSGVQKIVLPADAYYDDFSFRAGGAPVPETGTAVSFGLLLAAGGLVLLGRKRLAR